MKSFWNEILLFDLRREAGRVAVGGVRGGQSEQREQETLLSGEEGGSEQWQQQSGGGLVITRTILYQSLFIYIMKS